MHKKFNAFAVVVAILLIPVLFSGCKKQDNAGTTKYSPVYINVSHTINSSPLVLNQPYAMNGLGGKMLTFSSLRYYISGLVFVDTTGTYVHVNNYILVNTNQQEYLVADVPTGKYTDIKFLVGLDNYTNLLDPAGFTSDSPLSPQVPTMHFPTAGQGYNFFNVQGTVDTAGNGTLNTEYHYVTGGGGAVAVDLPDSTFMVIESQPVHINLHVALDNIFLDADLTHHLEANPYTKYNRYFMRNLNNMFNFN